MISICGARSASLPENGQPRLTSSAPGQVGSRSLSFQRLLARVRATWLVAALASAALGCSEDSADPAGVGGTTVTAGNGPGGQTSSAGTAGAAAGGTTATGGTGGGAGAVTPLGSFDFADGIEGWVFVYAEPPTLIDTTPPAPAGDAGVDAGAPPPPPPPPGVAVATHDPAVGDPLGNAGSVLLQLPFSGPSQKIEFEGNVATGAAGDVGINLAGRSITARIKVDSGLTMDPNNPAGVKIYVKTGPTSLYADSGYINLNTTTDWQTVIWANVSTAVYVDPAGAHTPTDVRQIGLEFDTGAAGVYTAATIHLDSVTY